MEGDGGATLASSSDAPLVLAISSKAFLSSPIRVGCCFLGLLPSYPKILTKNLGSTLHHASTVSGFRPTKNSPAIPLWVGGKPSVGMGVKYEVLQGAAELKDTIPHVVSAIAEREWIRLGVCTTVTAWCGTGGRVEGG